MMAGIIVRYVVAASIQLMGQGGSCCLQAESLFVSLAPCHASTGRCNKHIHHLPGTLGDRAQLLYPSTTGLESYTHQRLRRCTIRSCDLILSKRMSYQVVAPWARTDLRLHATLYIGCLQRLHRALAHVHCLEQSTADRHDSGDLGHRNALSERVEYSRKVTLCICARCRNYYRLLGNRNGGCLSDIRCKPQWVICGVFVFGMQRMCHCACRFKDMVRPWLRLEPLRSIDAMANETHMKTVCTESTWYNFFATTADVRQVKGYSNSCLTQAFVIP